ncbi:MAG: hypothetical protein ACSNEK_00510 [Parachlamydiaceae bacterium]
MKKKLMLITLSYVLTQTQVISHAEFPNYQERKEEILALYKDDRLKEALRAYARLLQKAPLVKSYSISAEEVNAYNDALAIYLNPRNSPYESGELIKDKYATLIHSRPHYYQLGYLVGIAYANLSQFDRFFDLFYDSYRRLPENYLAYKGKILIHAKLFELASDQDEKEQERALILQNIEKAKEENSKDFSLYKLEIIFSNNKGPVVMKNVQDLMTQGTIIPRTELPFYFDELFAYGYLDLAKKLIKKAREWYPFSRTLDAAEEFINQKQALKE